MRPRRAAPEAGHASAATHTATQTATQAATIPGAVPPGWTRLAPQAKLASMLATAVAVVALPVTAYAAFVAIAAVLAGLLVSARIRPRWLLRRIWIGTPVALYALLLPFTHAHPTSTLVGLPWSPVGAQAGAALFIKAVLSLLAASLVAATTPSADLLVGAQRLGFPPRLIEVAGFMLRYLDLVTADLQRTRTSMAARGFRGRGAAAARLLAPLLGHLFVRTFERGERVYQAMHARGYDGRVPDLGRRSVSVDAWLTAGLVPAFAWGCYAWAHLAR